MLAKSGRPTGLLNMQTSSSHFVSQGLISKLSLLVQITSLILLLNSVVERLTALGWGKEIEEMADESVLRRHKLVWQIKPLTDRSRTCFSMRFEANDVRICFLVWSTIEPAMIELMESVKAARNLVNHNERSSVCLPGSHDTSGSEDVPPEAVLS